MARQEDVELGIALCVMEIGKMEAEIAEAEKDSKFFHAVGNTYRNVAQRLAGLANGGWVVKLPAN